MKAIKFLVRYVEVRGWLSHLFGNMVVEKTRQNEGIRAFLN